MIQCLLIKNLDLVLISKVEQVQVEQLSGDPDCKLINPVRILCRDEEPDITKRMVRWPDSELSQQNILMMHSDSILTIVEPHEKLVKAYEEFIKE
jgi:hypothetical protein